MTGTGPSYLASLVRDIVGLGAVASVTFGVWQIYAPAAWIVGGFFLLAGLYLHDKNGPYVP
jgi:hypothetical protein